MPRFTLTQLFLEKTLEELSARDPDIRAAVKFAGCPEERRNPGGFSVLVRIIVAQQLSIKAAATITQRLYDAVGDPFTPERLAMLEIEDIRAVGLSRQKAGYCKGLAETITQGQLDVAALVHLPDEEVIEAITAMKGFGRWSAQMYLLSTLGRPDVWPTDDLGICIGVQKLKSLPDRPDKLQMEAIAESWRPHRGVVAIFLWHYLDALKDL